MSRAVLCFILFLALPAITSAASKELSARGWLGLVPPVPDNADQAYAQWKDDWEHCQPLAYGAKWQNLHDSIKAHQQDAANAVMADPSTQNAQRLAQQYGTPEAAARMAKMSPAQLMALAQKMQQQLGQNQAPAGPVSEHDAHIMELFDKKAQTEATVTHEETAFTTGKLVPLMQRWDEERDSFADQDLKIVQLDQNIVQVDNKYLPRVAKLVQELRAIEMPELDAVDAARDGWTQLQDAGIKQRLAANEHSAFNSGLSHVAVVAGIIEDASKKAAEDEANYKHARETEANGDNRTCN